jgi:DNA-binding response OmpR family regulator
MKLPKPATRTVTSARGLSGTAPSIPGFVEQGRILLVDDEIETWEGCLIELERSGYHVHTADDGDAGWEALQTREYDLLITDNNMPKISGLELIVKLRSHGMVLPIIFASSVLPVRTPELKPCFFDVRVLEKPVTPSRLLATIQSLALVRRHLPSHRFPAATEPPGYQPSKH